MKFPFDEPKNVAVFTCVHVLENVEDICYVTHDEDDGAWQFLCGQMHEGAEVRIVSLREIFNLDSSVGSLSNMPLGCGAVRDDKFSPWRGFKK